MFFPHSLHWRMPTSVSMYFSCTAVETSRCMPPLCPRGKRECGGGFILRSLAFSGRPILAPMRATALARTSRPMAWDTARSEGES